MTYDKFRALVAEMMDAQQTYFHLPRTNPEKNYWLGESKRLERAVRAELKAAKEEQLGLPLEVGG